MTIRALIFDFDGLILDTEAPEYQCWQEIYEAHGCSLAFSTWADFIGSTYTFDPYAYLEQQIGRPLDRALIRSKRHARFTELMKQQSILPGVEHYILEAKRLGLRLGIASSSPRTWVAGYLSELEITAHFDRLTCADDVQCTKPDPALYIQSLAALEVAAHEAIALEDSPNGVLAAKRAGIFSVAVPNELTRRLSFSSADLQLSSLEEMSLEQLLCRASASL